jgi:hypothetical protein
LTKHIKRASLASVADSPRILTLRVKPSEEGITSVFIEFGKTELERQIPDGQGLMRASVIFDDGGDLTDVELVTAKVEQQL